MKMKIKVPIKHSNKGIFSPHIITIERNQIIKDDKDDDAKICVSKKSREYSKEARAYVIGGICLFTSVVCSLTLWILLNNFKLVVEKNNDSSGRDDVKEQSKVEEDLKDSIVQHDSFDGCRNPNQIYNGLSCKTCCIFKGGNCTLQRAEGQYPPGGSGWYNSTRKCKADCPKCAQCSTRDEEDLKLIPPPVNCSFSDCANIKYGIDPCFYFGSCACFCRTVTSLLRACPDVKPTLMK